MELDLGAMDGRLVRCSILLLRHVDGVGAIGRYYVYLLTLGAKYFLTMGHQLCRGNTITKVISLIKLLLSEISNHKFSILINN